MTMTPEQKLVERDREMVPKLLVRAMFILCMSVLVIVTYAKLTDRPLAATPPTEAELPIIKEKVIRIYGAMDGSARVMDTEGNVILNLSKEEGGFVAGIYRVLERRRGAVGASGSDPIRLVQMADGRLALRDDVTDFRAELYGFGAANERVFARIMEE